MLLLFVFALGVALSLCDDGACPSGWTLTLDGASCIGGFKERLPWIKALQYCEEREATLVSLRNIFTSNLAYKIAQDTFVSCQYWIGLNDIETGSFLWTDKSAPVYSRWGNGFPVPSTDYRAAYMDVERGESTWRSTTKIAQEFCSLCEKKAAPKTTTTGTTATTTTTTFSTTTTSAIQETTTTTAISGKDCAEIISTHSSAPSGVYTLNDGITQVYCDMTTLGGGWTTLMRRIDDSGNFQSRTLDEYTNFFGDVHGSHWQSLKFMAALTKDFDQELLVEAKGLRGQPTADLPQPYYAFDRYSKQFAISETFKVYFYFHPSAADGGNMTNSAMDLVTMSDKSAFEIHNGDGYAHGGWWLKPTYKATDQVAMYLNGDYAQLGTNGMYVCQSTGKTTCSVVNPVEVSMKARKKTA